MIHLKEIYKQWINKSVAWYVMIWLIDFNSMSTGLGLFYA